MGHITPAGQWILSGGKLLAADGSLVAEPGRGGTWLSDSSGFYQLHYASADPAGIYLFRAANHWQPELVTDDDISSKAGFYLVNRCPSSN